MVERGLNGDDDDEVGVDETSDGAARADGARAGDESDGVFVDEADETGDGEDGTGVGVEGVVAGVASPVELRTSEEDFVEDTFLGNLGVDFVLLIIFGDAIGAAVG